MSEPTRRVQDYNFKLSEETIEQIEMLVNRVISTIEGSDDTEIKIVDEDGWEAILYVGVNSYYKKTTTNNAFEEEL